MVGSGSIWTTRHKTLVLLRPKNCKGSTRTNNSPTRRMVRNGIFCSFFLFCPGLTLPPHSFCLLFVFKHAPTPPTLPAMPVELLPLCPQSLSLWTSLKNSALVGFPVGFFSFFSLGRTMRSVDHHWTVHGIKSGLGGTRGSRGIGGRSATCPRDQSFVPWTHEIDDKEKKQRVRSSTRFVQQVEHCPSERAVSKELFGSSQMVPQRLLVRRRQGHSFRQQPWRVRESVDDVQ